MNVNEHTNKCRHKGKNNKENSLIKKERKNERNKVIIRKRIKKEEERNQIWGNICKRASVIIKPNKTCLVSLQDASDLFRSYQLNKTLRFLHGESLNIEVYIMNESMSELKLKKSAEYDRPWINARHCQRWKVRGEWESEQKLIRNSNLYVDNSLSIHLNPLTSAVVLSSCYRHCNLYF